MHRIGRPLAVALIVAATTSARAGECERPPSDGWARDYARYATWCKCCGGEPYSSPGVGCDKTSAWGRTACSGYSGADAARGGPASFFEAGVALAMAAPPEQAGAWIAAGAGLELLLGALSGNRDAEARQRAADAAREAERRRRAEEERERLEAIHARLSRSLKARSSWTGEAPTVGTLALKTDTNVFGTRRGGGGLVLKQEGEAAKHAAARVEGHVPPAPPSVEGRPVPLPLFQRLSVEFAERSDEAVAARAREDEARRRREEAERRRVEAERRVAELRRERERGPGEAPPAPPSSSGDAPAPPAQPPEAGGPDRLREAEELLRTAIGEEERQASALEQVTKDRADAETRLDRARGELRAHLDGKGERG